MRQETHITTDNKRILLTISDCYLSPFRVKAGTKINTELGEGKVIGIGETSYGLRVFCSLKKDLVNEMPRVSFWPSWIPGKLPKNIVIID